MKKIEKIQRAKTAVLALANIKAAVEAFERGETNVVDAIDRIMTAAEPCRAAAEPCRTAAKPKRKAA